MSSKEYSLLNILFAAFLFCLFAVSLFYDLDSNLISCQVLETTGKECKSCGLTRDFVSFTKLDFSSPINNQSISVFTWFVLQFVLRINFVAFSSRLGRKVMKTDLIASLISGILVFLPFWI